MTPQLKDAVISLVGLGTSYDSENGEIINWDTSEVQSGTTQPSEAEIATEITRLTVIYDAKDYARKRKAKYDALNQFELISDDAINGTTTHKDAIVAIKSEFPKPQE